MSEEANKLTAKAFAADVKEREEAQARFVYTTTTVPQRVRPGNGWTASGIDQIGGSGDLWEMNSESVGRGQERYTAKAEGLVVEYEIHNKSQEVIGPILLGLYDADFFRPDIENSLVGTDPLLPGESRKCAIWIVEPDGEHSPWLRPLIRFRDSSGRWWERRAYEPIVRLDPPPL